MNTHLNAQKDILIYPVPPKIKGQYDFILLELINDSISIKTYYRFIYKNNHFTICRKNTVSDNCIYAKLPDGNVIESKKNNSKEIIFYTSQNFKEKVKNYPSNYYDIFSTNFIDMTNGEKKDILDKLIEKHAKKN